MPSQQGPAPFHIYATSTLQELSTSPIPFADWPTIFNNLCDPNGNFVYAMNGTPPGTGVQVYFVDPDGLSRAIRPAYFAFWPIVCLEADLCHDGRQWRWAAEQRTDALPERHQFEFRAGH